MKYIIFRTNNRFYKKTLCSLVGITESKSSNIKLVNTNLNIFFPLSFKALSVAISFYVNHNLSNKEILNNTVNKKKTYLELKRDR